ncbi:putative transcriptional regulator [Planosporangium mesophilum]|uniref:Putative transcriptional regulator n=1 Tax=Planosporangium mesophilum TaxID=689768 RepID=A0A8J3TH00_9ACTN|nr:putative transcriptional regulator [Planosporangium mesophilum]
MLVISGAILMLLSGTAIAGGRVLMDRYTGAVHQQSLLGSEAMASGTSINGPLTVLLVGIDERPGENAEGSRSDSIILLHVSANHDAAYLVSIPRDSRVTIPPFPKSRYPGGTDKINSAFFFGSQNGGGRAGGFELLALTIKKMTGITFNAGAIVNFSGFQAVTKALGGVHMCVDEKVTSIHIGQDSKGKFAAPYRMTPDLRPIPVPGVKPQVYEPGCYDMSDWQALDYVRQRELVPDGDYGRQRHQQQFVKALAKKTLSSGVVANPTKLDGVLRAAGQALTVDSGKFALSNWLFTLKDINPNNVAMIKTNAGNFHSEIIDGQAFETLDPTSLELFQAIRDDNVDSFVAANPSWVNSDGGPQS